jgi:DNA-binding winged helix-turn-helix (wHTH) protein
MSQVSHMKFGVYEVDLHAGELRKRGVKVKLQAQPFGVLALLLERPGEVVSREDLRQKLWPTDVFVDFDQGLNKAINKLREALGDSADNPRFIETVPRRGYRFIAPTTTNGSAEAAADSAPPRPERRGNRYILAAIVLLSIGMLAGGMALFRTSRNQLADSLAVLPLSGGSGPDLEYLGDGITETIINSLSQLPGLRVMARSTVFHYKGKDVDPRVVGRELGVFMLCSPAGLCKSETIWSSAWS